MPNQTRELDRLIAEAERFVPGLREHTQVQVVLTPEDFRTRTHLEHHGFGGIAPIMGKQNPAHQTPVDGLWFIGAQSESGAAERGAAILAEVLGYAMTTDPGEPCAGDRLSAMARALELAVERAGVDPRDVGQVVAGGMGAVDGAAGEVAVERVLRNRVRPFSLAGRIGYAEAALPLINLGYRLARAEAGDLIAAVSASPEGFASAVILAVRSG